MRATNWQVFSSGRLLLSLPIDKKQFFERLVQVLRKEALHSVKASQDAADYATDDESRAESKWDTQGLEASYLAQGQAGQARQWAKALETLQSDRDILLTKKSDVALGALFTCDLGGFEEVFFFSSVAGGQVIEMGDQQVTVITAQSPLANRLLGLKAGDEFTLPNGRSGMVLAIE